MRITKIIRLRVKVILMIKRGTRSGAFGLLVSATGSALGCKAVDIHTAVGGRTVTIDVLVAVGAVVVVCVVRAVCVRVRVCR